MKSAIEWPVFDISYTTNVLTLTIKNELIRIHQICDKLARVAAAEAAGVSCVVENGNVNKIENTSFKFGKFLICRWKWNILALMCQLKPHSRVFCRRRLFMST